jgi:5'(3')-deoxyribonucleotidase
VDETSKDHKTVFDKFYDDLKNYKTKKLLEDMALVGMGVKNVGNMATKIYRNLSMESHLFQNMSIKRFHGSCINYTSGIILHVSMG